MSMEGSFRGTVTEEVALLFRSDPHPRGVPSTAPYVFLICSGCKELRRKSSLENVA